MAFPFGRTALSVLRYLSGSQITKVTAAQKRSEGHFIFYPCETPSIVRHIPAVSAWIAVG